MPTPGKTPSPTKDLSPTRVDTPPGPPTPEKHVTIHPATDEEDDVHDAVSIKIFPAEKLICWVIKSLHPTLKYFRIICLQTEPVNRTWHDFVSQKGKRKKKKEKKEKRRKKKSEYEVAEGITTPSKEQLPPSQAATPAAYKLPVS